MCVAMLKFHTKDGGTGLNTNHFKYASTDIHYHVALLLSAVVCHGNVPKDFLLCTTIPMPKGLSLVTTAVSPLARYLVD